jgi:hypothetical protein
VQKKEVRTNYHAIKKTKSKKTEEIELALFFLCEVCCGENKPGCDEENHCTFTARL